MDDHTDSHKVSRLQVIDTGRRRRFTQAEKQRIVAESYSGHRMASATARRHDIMPGLLFLWRRLAREGKLAGDAAGFLPVSLTLETGAPLTDAPVAGGADLRPETRTASDPAAPDLSRRQPLRGGRLEIVLCDGVRVIAEDLSDYALFERVLGLLARR